MSKKVNVTALGTNGLVGRPVATLSVRAPTSAGVTGIVQSSVVLLTNVAGSVVFVPICRNEVDVNPAPVTVIWFDDHSDPPTGDTSVMDGRGTTAISIASDWFPFGYRRLIGVDGDDSAVTVTCIAVVLTIAGAMVTSPTRTARTAPAENPVPVSVNDFGAPSS